MAFRDEIRGFLADGNAVTVSTSRMTYPVTVAVVPGSGCTVSVEYTINGSTWTAWPNGSVTAYSVDVLDSPVVSLRFTRTAGSVATSQYNVIPRRD